MSVNIGDKIQLKNQEVEVVKCKDCDKSMVNIDTDQLAVGDLATLKNAGVTVSNPETTDNVCVHCEYKPTIGHKLAQYFEGAFSSKEDDEDKEDKDEDDDDDDSDSHFFGSTGFLGGIASGGFGGGFSGGGFGGFGGGAFSGGGASASF